MGRIAVYRGLKGLNEEVEGSRGGRGKGGGRGIKATSLLFAGNLKGLSQSLSKKGGKARIPNYPKQTQKSRLG